MTQDDFFDLSLEEDFDSFNPLSDFDVDDDDTDIPLESGIMRPEPKEFPTADALVQSTEQMAAQPAAVRIATLFDNMQPSRKLLLLVMERCLEPQSNEAIVEIITDYMRNAKSIFTPELILHHLHRAGALERLTEEGDDYEELDLEPKTVVIDGVEYLESTMPPEIWWHTTPEGAEMVEGNRPADRLTGLIDSEPQYRTIFTTVLEYAARPEGTSEKELGNLLNNEPVLQKPRMYAQRFIGKLNECEALVWQDKRWRITDLGREALARLTAEEDSEA